MLGRNLKKPPDDQAKEQNGHALVIVHASLDTCILDSGASDHMAASKDSFSSLEPCTNPPILMGDDKPIQVCGKGVIDLEHGYFQNVLQVPLLSTNLLSIYQITHSGSKKQVVFTPEPVVISDISNKSKVAVGVADHKYRLHSFSHFIPNSSPTLHQTHGNEVSRLDCLTGKLFIARSVKFEEGHTCTS